MLAALAATASVAARADVPTAYEELYKAMRAPNAVTALGTKLFGDNVNLYNGALDFAQTDVSLPGNNALPVSIGRRITAGEYSIDGRAFGKWELDIPHISGTFPRSIGWLSVDGNANRCSSFGAPPMAVVSTAAWDSSEYWQGTFIHVPGQGKQQMLSRAPGFNTAPGLAQDYPVVTKQFWNFSCLASVAGDTHPGSAGQGFLAVSPNGTKYYFDWAARFNARTLVKSEQASQAALASPSSPPESALASGPSAKSAAVKQSMLPVATAGTRSYTMLRDEMWLLPSKVVDRFGNVVTYTYDPARPRNLTRIDASDGRTITLTYRTDANGNDQVATVFDGTRTWSYGYHVEALDSVNMSNLDRVTLPDGSAWNFASFDSLLHQVKLLNNGGCDGLPLIGSGSATGSIVHPSGASGSFTIVPTIHGRSHIARICNIYASSEALVVPRYFATASLTNKTISGPGLPTTTWTFNYGPTNASFDDCTTCVSTKTVSVTDPALNVARFTFGNQYQVNEGRLQLTENGWDGSSALSSIAQRYRLFPTIIGSASQTDGGDSELDSRLAPVDQRVTTQQGVTFTWEATQFDSFARATSVTKSSGLNPGRTETTGYVDNLSKWILGQTGSVTETSTGATMVLNAYDPTTSTLTSVTKFGHLDATMTYYADGTLSTVKDGKNQATTYSNYKRGIPQNIAYADGSSISAVVDNIGNFSSLTNATGFATSFGYTAGRLSSISYPTDPSMNGTTLTFAPVAAIEYDLPAGHWKQTVSTGNSSTISYYDALWRPVYSYTADTANPGGTARWTKRQFDHNGHTIFESYPKRTLGDNVDGVQTQYDALGRVSASGTSSELGMLWTTYGYLGGFQKSVTDPKGHVTTYSYQAFDEPSDSAVSAIAAPLGVNVGISRDIFGKTTSITRSDGTLSATRSYVYDGMARLCKTIEPETGATVQDYDAANNVLWRASGNALPSSICDTGSVPTARKVSFTYDAMNRLANTSYADGSPSITRTYTSDGLPLTITSNGSVWTNSYNNRRLNTNESLSYGGATYNIARGYDANGSLTTLTYPDGVSIAHSPNALGQPTQVGGYASAIAYSPNGAIASFTYGNGVTHTLAQNPRGLPSQSTDAGVLNDSYTYDANGNVASITDQQTGTTNRTMGHDDLDRLTSVSAPNLWGNATYTYDALDNLRTSTITGGATARTLTMGYPDPSTNRLMSTSGGPAGFNFDYRYDLQGNIIQRGTQSYVFDQGNRMTSAPGKASYAYDGLGHRISVVGTDGVNRVQVYSQVGQLMYTVPTGSAGTRYIYMHNHMLAEVGPGGVQYDHTDGLGSPVARTDANRALISQTRYEPYGYTAAGAVPGIGFTGHVNDVDTALVYMQQRYYDPVAGRFLSIDPVTTDEDTGDSFNRYAYAENNPYRYVDPDGRQVLQIPLPPPPPTVTITGKRPRSDPFASPVQSSSQQGDPVARKLVEIYNNLTSSSPAAPPPEDDKDKKKKKEEAKDGKKLKKLSPGEIRGLEREGLGAHELKSSSSRFDIYKDSEGNLYQMLKGGKGEPSSLNINIRNL